jgi:hypothetical protein
MSSVSAPSERELRDRATTRLTERRDFRVHVATYLVVNAMLWLLWAVTGADGSPWPIWVTLGWGIGLAAHWLSLRRRPISARAVAEEMDRLRRP